MFVANGILALGDEYWIAENPVKKTRSFNGKIIAILIVFNKK